MKNILSQYSVYITIVACLLILLLAVEIVNIAIKIGANKREVQLDQYNIEINAPMDTSIINMLDEFIKKEFDDYTILNIECKQDLIYINNDLEQKINKDVAYNVLKRVSPIMLLKLSMYYNKNSLNDIIINKIYMMTLTYVIGKNAPKNKINNTKGA